MFNSFRVNPKAKSEINTGFGVNSSDYGGRFFNKNGKPNVEIKGIGFLRRTSWYHVLLDLPRYKFLLVILLFFILINIVFAGIYLIFGVSRLVGQTPHTITEKVEEAFFFSCQTFTTVGYGRISPNGFLASIIAALEAFTGLLSIAVVTGLLYGRFSRPKAYIKFSENALLAPFHKGRAIMLRLAPYKNTTLTDVEAKVSLGLIVEENGTMVNKFYQLPLEYRNVNSLTLSWTIVHPITETSPFFEFSEEDFKNAKGEILVFVKAFDDMFSNTVVTRTSYTLSEIVLGAKFDPMFHRSHKENNTQLYLNKLNSFSKAKLPELKTAT